MVNNTSERMHSSSVSPGDMLYKLDLDSWSGRIVYEAELAVEKVTKTRIVCSTTHGKEIRILLDKDGWVTNRMEGNTREHVRLFTPDDEKLAQHRERNRVEELKVEANQKVKVWSSNGSDPSAARNAARALQEYADARDAIDAREATA